MLIIRLLMGLMVRLGDVMQQLVFAFTLAELRNRIVTAQNTMEYHGCHKSNSLRLHLGVSSLEDCEDLDALVVYLEYLEGRRDANRV